MPALEINRVIAYNLKRARQWRDLSQEQVAELLQPFHPQGKRVGKATISAAERSLTAPPGRVRKFTADDLVAYSKAFGLPVWWFLMHPEKSRTPTGEEPTVEQLRLIETEPVAGAVRWSLFKREHSDVLEAWQDELQTTKASYVPAWFVEDDESDTES